MVNTTATENGIIGGPYYFGDQCRLENVSDHLASGFMVLLTCHDRLTTLHTRLVTLATWLQSKSAHCGGSNVIAKISLPVTQGKVFQS
jgi:hypothetical protein